MENQKWVARLRPLPGHSLREFLERPLSIDVWERDENSLVVLAKDSTLTELKRRNMAVVEKLNRVC